MYSDVFARKQPGPPPSTASCYICFEDGTDSESQPLLRNCACRGEAGWAHVACLAKFADSKITEARRKQERSVDFAAIWQKCILCKTPYMGNIGLAMAEACVKIYEDLSDPEARMFSLDSMATINVKLGNHNDALKSYNRLLDIYKIATGKGVDVRRLEIGALEGMILVYMEMNRCNVAIALIERHIEIGIDLEGPNSSLVQDKRQMLTMLHSVIGEGSDHKRDTAAELVWARKKFKEVQNNGMESRLSSHIVVVNALKDDGKTEEAMEQFEKMLSESRQVLGSNHPATLRYENSFNDYYTGKQEAGKAEIQKKNVLVWAVIDYEKKPAIHGQRVKVLRATKKDAGIYICQFKNRNDVSTKVKVVHDQFILDAGTAVVVHGLVSSKALNGSTGIIQSFDKEKCRYNVLLGTKKAHVLIKPKNLNIVFA